MEPWSSPISPASCRLIVTGSNELANWIHIDVLDFAYSKKTHTVLQVWISQLTTETMAEAIDYTQESLISSKPLLCIICQEDNKQNLMTVSKDGLQSADTIRQL